MMAARVTLSAPMPRVRTVVVDARSRRFLCRRAPVGIRQLREAGKGGDDRG